MSDLYRNCDASVTITRRGNCDGINTMVVSIEDEKSGLKVCEVEVSLESMMQALTGLACVPAQYNFMPTQYTVERYGKRRITERVRVDKASNKDSMSEVVKADFEQRFSGDWELFSDGTKSRQDKPQHEYVIMRFEDTDDG